MGVPLDVAVIDIVPFDGPVDASIRPPGSKSITNRALLTAALADGRSTLTGALLADDTEAMLGCIRELGAAVEIGPDGTTIVIDGIGGDLTASSDSFFARQSGTTARFIAATLALADRPLLLDADEAMRRRPMGEVFRALERLGVAVDSEGGSLPVTIRGPVVAQGSMPTVRLSASVSSQFTSGLLLAAACMTDGLRIEIDGEIVSRPYLEMTAAVMRSFGATVDSPDRQTFVVQPGGYRGTDYDIEPDASAASYFFALAAICGGRVVVEGIGSGSLQGDIHFVDVLESMGAIVERSEDSIAVTGAALMGVDADFSQISDTAQTIAAVAAFADGATRVSGIDFIRNKETDRIAAVVHELQRLGIEATEDVDGFTVNPGPIRPATIETYDDHRMAMSMALIGLHAPGVSIADPSCVRKTFPSYFDVIERLRPGRAT